MKKTIAQLLNDGLQCYAFGTPELDALHARELGPEEIIYTGRLAPREILKIRRYVRFYQYIVAHGYSQFTLNTLRPGQVTPDMENILG